VADPADFDHDQRHENRRATDESLERERRTADALLADDQGARAEDLVHNRLTEAERRLREARHDVDEQLERESDALPRVSGKLEEAADSLAKAATSMSGEAAQKTVELASPAGAGGARLARVAEQVAETAAEMEATADAVAPQAITGQLAEIADGMAEVTETLATEREDVDLRLERERTIADRIIGQELEEVQAAIADEVRTGRELLEQERDVTDDRLADERQHTDQAVDHVVDLLVSEQAQHAAAERRAVTRNEILRIVSHDLRGPLMAIGGAAALIQAHAPEGETGRRLVDWTVTIRRSVSMMERLIRDLLDVGSLEDGRLRVFAQTLDVRELIRATIDVFAPVAAASRLSLASDVPAEPVLAHADEHRIMQVLSNLVHNAIKFTPAGGTIRLRAESTGEGCVVSVSDSGIGIPEGELTSIFERFRRLEENDRTGLGLGLYISQWIVEAHGGRIWAESRVGDGTTIFFTLR